MNASKNKTLVGVVVGILVLGVAMTYVPLLFAPQTPGVPAVTNNLPASNETASLPNVVNATTSTSTQNSPKASQGFFGLDKESQQLNDLNSQLSK